LLGFETAPLPAPGIQTPVGASGPITYLFRKTFTFSGNPVGATVSIDQVLDDGAAYYLNGNLLPPVGYNPGGAWDQTSSRTIGDATEELNAVSGAATGLVNGTNTIAVEVHQTSNTSSDMVFGTRLKISTTPSVVINEVKPGAAGAGFVEFFNTTASVIDLNGYYLSDTPGNLTVPNHHEHVVGEQLRDSPDLRNRSRVGATTVGISRSRRHTLQSTVMPSTGARPGVIRGFDKLVSLRNPDAARSERKHQREDGANVRLSGRTLRQMDASGGSSCERSRNQ
jgi:hypothetical protein